MESSLSYDRSIYGICGFNMLIPVHFNVSSVSVWVVKVCELTGKACNVQFFGETVTRCHVFSVSTCQYIFESSYLLSQ